MFSERTSVGLDVHSRSVAAAGLDTVTGEVWERRLRPDGGEVLSWLSTLPAPVAVTYEAGPTGSGWPGTWPRPGTGVRSRPRRRSAGHRGIG